MSCQSYRVDDPWGSIPRGRIDGSPQIKEEDGGDPATREMVGLVLGRLDDVDVGADDPHADGTRDGTAEEQFPAAELVDEEEQPDKGHDGLDDAKDTRH